MGLGVVAGKRSGNQKYKVHGEGVSSLVQGFDEIGMPEYRRSAALVLLGEVLAANDVTDFYWYMPPATEELCCYWDAAEQNQLWINAGELHVMKDEKAVRRPARPLTYSKQDGDYVGWLLPGGQGGTGGGPQKPKIASVLCPKTFLYVPAGVPCDECDIVHES